MDKELVDGQGNPVKEDNEVIASLDQVDGINLSPMGMAMLDVMITAQLLNLYGAQTILSEAPDSIDEINKVVSAEIEKVGEFSIEHVKQHLMMSFQIVCTHLAESHAQAIVTEGIEAYRRKIHGDAYGVNDEPVQPVAADEVVTEEDSPAES